MSEDFYAILGVPRDASNEDIRHAFLDLAKQCHPDLHPNEPEAAEKFKQIQRAFEKLYKPWRWRAKHAVFTPESVLAEIARANRSRRTRDVGARRVLAEVICLVF